MFGHFRQPFRKCPLVEILVEIRYAFLAGVDRKGGINVDAIAVPQNIDSGKSRLIHRLESLDVHLVF